MISKRATSRDVARLAGVAQSTVSYALNGRGPVAPETRAKIMAAALELDYQPNLIARSMRSQRTHRIAVVMGLTPANPPQMIVGAAEAAEAAGFSIEVHLLEGTIQSRSQQVDQMSRSGQFEGILSFASVLPEVEKLSSNRVPIVVPETYDAEMQSVGDLADATPIATMISQLADWGHHRFLHIAGPTSYLSAVERISVYEQTIEKLGLESLGVVGFGWSGETGFQAISELPENLSPLAVIAANDIVALGALRAASLRGWSVPSDISLTGWNNDQFGRYLLPTLTTVDIDRVEGGRREMNRLLAAMDPDNVAAPKELPPLTSVIWRESTAAPSANRN